MPVDSTFAPDSSDAGSSQALAVSTTLSKTEDGAFLIPAERTTDVDVPFVPGAYADWTTTEPPRTIPTDLSPDPSLIHDRTTYHSFSNVTHRGSLVLPFFPSQANDYGVVGTTSWTEPLGKHTINVGGALSLSEPWTDSEIAATYVNRQLYPTVTVTAFSASSSARIYGSDLLVEDRTGAEVNVRWPLDWRVRPYVSTSISARLRYADFDPLPLEDFAPASSTLAAPQAGQQASLRLQFTRRKKPPHRHTLVHPMEGWGVRVRATGAASVLGGDTSFLRGDLAGYQVLPSFADHRLFLYGPITGTNRVRLSAGLDRILAVRCH